MRPEIESFYHEYLASPFRLQFTASRFNNLLWLYLLSRALRPTIIIDSGTYRGGIIGETEKILIQQITSHSAAVHRKDLLDMIPAVGENVRIAYSNDNARVLPVKERSKTQELGR